MGTSGNKGGLPLPIIDPRRCAGHGRCVELCPTGAVALVEGMAVIVKPEACSFCEICETYCPEGAIGRPFTISFASARRAAS